MPLKNKELQHSAEAAIALVKEMNKIGGFDFIESAVQTQGVFQSILNSTCGERFEKCKKAAVTFIKQAFSTLADVYQSLKKLPDIIFNVVLGFVKIAFDNLFENELNHTRAEVAFGVSGNGWGKNQIIIVLVNFLCTFSNKLKNK